MRGGGYQIFGCVISLVFGCGLLAFGSILIAACTIALWTLITGG